MEIKHPKKIFDFNKITPQIYIGTNQCCQMHFNKMLIKKGVKGDISLEKSRLDQPFGVDYYCWLPTKNHTPPSFKQLSLGTKIIRDLIDNKIPIYVHCKNGHGRAPTLVAAYLITQGKTTNQSIDFIKKRRKSIHLDKSQVKALKDFEKRMKKK